MELEADHFAIFTLQEAGYDPEKGGKVLVRMSRLLAGDRIAGRKSFVSYFNTHPADDYRFAAWMEGIAALKRGQAAPVSLEAIAQQKSHEREMAARAKQTARYNSAYCVAVRKEYPECNWWKNEYAWDWGWKCPSQGAFPLLFPRDKDCSPAP